MAQELKTLPVRPGLFTNSTDAEAEGRWKDGDKVRFKNARPEKIGGWVKSSENTFLGICRALIEWQALAKEKYIGLGTHSKLYVWQTGTFYDVTPQGSTGTLGDDPITTANTSTIVTIAHTTHGRAVGDYVSFSGATAVGGITISGEYEVKTVVDANSYTITHSSAATSTATGGGASVNYVYLLSSGSSSSIYGYGYGSGAYGLSTYGTARTVASILFNLRVWSLDKWGDDMIASPREGAIYLWDKSAGTNTRAAAISGSPTTARSVFVSQEDRRIVALGAHNGTTDDPMLVRWSDDDDYATWTAAATNTAGQKRLTHGNEILCRIPVRGGDLIQTDNHATLMTSIGPPHFYAFLPVGGNGGMMGPNAGISLDGVAYWMGENDFFLYDGAIRAFECDVYPTVFKNINKVQRWKVYAGYNRKFREVWWLYPSESATECDRYVLYSIDEKVWSFGTLARTAMVGGSELFTVPFAAGSDGYLYDHETGVDADGSAMTAYIESGDVDIVDGDSVMHIGKAVPDFQTLTGSVNITVKGRKYPQDIQQSSSGPHAVTATTKYINPRLRARQASVLIQSDDMGDHWRFGKIRLELRPDGRR